MGQLTQEVVRSFSKIENTRQRLLLTRLIESLHNYVKDVELTQDEWALTIDFLTQTGQKCHAQRQEFILLSDVLGVSMLVDEINHHKHEQQTPSTVFGPFYLPDMPVRDYGSAIFSLLDEGQLPLLITGRIVDQDFNPIENAKIDIWQTAHNGMYSGQDPEQAIDHLRGVFYSKEQGEYAIQSILPVSYQIPSDGPVGTLLNFAERLFGDLHIFISKFRQQDIMIW